MFSGIINFKFQYEVWWAKLLWNTVDSLLYASTNSGFATNRENVNSQTPIFKIITPNSLHLSEKLKRNFNFREMCFSRFPADINSLRLVRYFQYDKTNSKFNEYELNICQIQLWLKKKIFVKFAARKLSHIF